MKLGIIGLGKMGSAIAHRVLLAGYKVVGYDSDVEAGEMLKKMGGEIVASLHELPKHAEIIWLMVPAGDPVDEVLSVLQKQLQHTHILIDGGNSKFTDSIRRAQELKKHGISFLDCGTSGGLRGQDIGFSLMIGGEYDAFRKAELFFKAIAAPSGYGYMGQSGAGHYVKMVHNGIEYALLQAYAEGFHLLKDGQFKQLDLSEVASVWCNGSVIRSWILELCHEIFLKDQSFKNISGKIEESGMGRWTVEEAQKQKIPVTLIDDALEIRFWSKESGGNYATKLVALLRNKFGGHPIQYLEEDEN